MGDKELIMSLGGPTVVARLLGFDTKKGGVQRVQNWVTRGVPAAIKVKHQDIFLRGTTATAQSIPSEPQPATGVDSVTTTGADTPGVRKEA